MPAVAKITVTLQITQTAYDEWNEWAKYCSMSLAAFIRESVKRQGKIVAGFRPEPKSVHIDATE